MSRFVAVTTMLDRGAADVAKEVLEAAGITVEIRSVPPIRYFGAATPDEIEVRVPEERLVDAHKILEHMEGELGHAAEAEANAGVTDGSDGDLPTPELRPRKASWALALALVFPLPCLPVGLIYARAPAILPFGIFGFAIAMLFLRYRYAYEAAILMPRIVDAVLAPIFARRFNHALLTGKKVVDAGS